VGWRTASAAHQGAPAAAPAAAAGAGGPQQGLG